MAFDILYPTDDAQFHRHSSIDQFRGFLSTMAKGGWVPIVFDQLDGINCETVISHPVIISFGDDIGYIYPEGHCPYSSDHFIYVDKYGVEQKLLPECFGGKGEFFEYFSDKNAFINFDAVGGDASSLGLHQSKELRVGLSYVIADKTLPAVD